MKLGKRETPHMLEMFNFYLGLGEKRTLIKVAKRYRKSEAFVNKVSQTWKWVDRVDKIEREAAEKALEATKTQLQKSKERVARVAQAIQGRFAQKLSADKINVTVQDWERAAKMELLIEGGETERVEHTHTFAHLIEDADDNTKARDTKKD